YTVTMPSNATKSKSLFAMLTKEAGLHLKDGCERNEISVDKAVFQKKISLSLKRCQGDVGEVLDEFLEGFSEYIEDSYRFHKSLLPTYTTADCDSARSKVQDSAVRILLGVEIVQPFLIRNLLEKLPEFSQDDNMLLELLEATDIEVQREIIGALPAVVDDSDHVAVATKLKDMLVSKTQLTVIILDALACLDLNPDLLTQVRVAATQALHSVDAENLPVVLKFLLRTASAADLMEVVGEIRSGLDLASVVVAGKNTLSRNSHAKRGSEDRHRDSEMLIVDTIQSGIQFQRGAADVWLKTIDGVKEKLKVLDLVVLLILHQTNRRKSVESLVRNKIRSGAFSETLLQTAFSNNSQVLQGKFKAVLSVAEVLLRSPEVALCYMGHVLYKQAFCWFDTFSRQEIVANLVMHLGSGNVDEMDASLDVLASLVEQHLAAMAPYAVFFKRLLDFQQQSLSLLCLRKLFSMLARLAFTASHDPALIQDDLHMVIRKLISSLDLNAGSEPVGELSDAKLQEVVSLLTMLRDGSGRLPGAAALFLDELAAIVAHGSLHPKVEAWISENMTDMFQENFVVDVEEDHSSDSTVPMSAQFCLNDKEESDIVINLLPLVSNELMDAKSPGSARAHEGHVYSVCLSPHFHLVQTCERRQQAGNMEGIDALLGCPVYLPDEDVYSKIESLSVPDKDVVCTSLFHCINWFREVVNAFASQADVEMKGKVIERLHDITHLMEVLAKCLSAHPQYTPPLLGLGADESNGQQVLATTATKGKAGGEKKRAGRKRKRAGKENDKGDDGTQDITDVTQSEKDTQAEDGAQEHGKKVEDYLAAFSSCFRELELDVFYILHTGPIVQASLDTELHTKRTHEVRIQSTQLQFLLEDLVKKLNHSLIATANKRRSFPKAKSSGKSCFSSLDQKSAEQVAKFTVDMLPALCSQLETASAFFQALVADNDGVVDGPGSHTPEAVRMATCLQLLLQSLLALFSWNGFLLAHNRHLLKDALSVLVGRVNMTGPTQQSMAELLRGAFQYVEKFAETVPTLAAATILIRLLTVLASKSEEEALQHRLADLARKMLEREWRDASGQPEKGAACNEQLQVLVRTWVANSPDPTQPMQTIADTGMGQLLQAGRQASSTTFATLTRSSFCVFLRVVLTELVENVKHIEPLKRTDGRQIQEERLLSWGVAVRILLMAVSVVKEINSRAGIAACLKSGRQFVEVFLQRGMPVLDATFTSHSADVQSLLRTLQQSTRALQNMCGHAKRTQDVSQVNQVPVLKRALERLVLRVKHMLTLNNCQRAFWMGNLKNKTLKGEEILSQAAEDTESQAESNVEEEEEEALPDDDDSEVEMDTAETTEATSEDSGDGSYSQMY
ncbi:hypothetical protein BaRGS_00014829, partial [Batillaria attramentaria]